MKVFWRYFIFISLALLPFLFVNHLFFLKDPPVWPDEPVFYQMADNLLIHGAISTNIYGGIFPDLEKTQLGYPPLYFYLMSGWIGLFGQSIEVLRAFSLFLAIITLAVFYLTAKRIFKRHSWAFLGTLLLSLNINFTRASHLGRMEMQMLLFMMLCFWTAILAQSKKRLSFYLIPGTFAALAALTHPTGTMVPLILLLIIIFQNTSVKKKFYRLIFAGLPVAGGIFLWFLTNQQQILPLAQSLLTHFHDKSLKPPFAFVLWSSDLSWRFLLTMEFAIALIFLFRFVQNRADEKLRTLFIALTVSAVFSLLAKEGGYMLYFQPFLILALVSVLATAGFIKNDLPNVIFIVPLLLVIANLNIQFFNNDNLAITDSGKRSLWSTSSYSYHQYTAAIENYLMKEIPPDKKAGIFISATPDPYFDLKNNPNLRFYETADPYFPIDPVKYKKVLDSTDYIIFTWIPHQILADYINKNVTEKVLVGQQNGYSVVVAKLKPLSERK